MKLRRSVLLQLLEELDVKNISFTELITCKVEFARGTKCLPEKGCVDLENELEQHEDLARRTLLLSPRVPAKELVFRGDYPCYSLFHQSAPHTWRRWTSHHRRLRHIVEKWVGHPGRVFFWWVKHHHRSMEEGCWLDRSEGVVVICRREYDKETCSWVWSKGAAVEWTRMGLTSNFKAYTYACCSISFLALTMFWLRQK